MLVDVEILITIWFCNVCEEHFIIVKDLIIVEKNSNIELCYGNSLLC